MKKLEQNPGEYETAYLKSTIEQNVKAYTQRIEILRLINSQEAKKVKEDEPELVRKAVEMVKKKNEKQKGEEMLL